METSSIVASPSQAEIGFHSLPDDKILDIFKYLPNKNLNVCSLVCKHWKKITERETLISRMDLFVRKSLIPIRSENGCISSFKKHPIVKLFENFKNFNQEVVDLFINLYLDKNITSAELTEACDWAYWKEKKLEEFSKRDFSYRPNYQAVGVQLGSIYDAILLKKVFKERYPNSKVEFNSHFPPAFSDWNPTRRWCTIDGKNANEFDDEHHGGPIDLDG